MRDVGDRYGSRTARAMEWAIQWSGRVTLSMGLQGGDVTMWDLRKVASEIL